MKKLLTFVIISVIANQSESAVTKIERNSIMWSSQESRKRLFEAKYKENFFLLAPRYSPQEHAIECGIASAKIVINTIYQTQGKKIKNKDDRSFVSKSRNMNLDYCLFADDDILPKDNSKGLPTRKDVRGEGQNGHQYIGIDIWDYPKVFKNHGLNAKYFQVDKNNKKNKEMFINALKDTLNSKKKFMIAFFEGHISPVAAYDEASNSILILDVEQHKTEWYWTSIDLIVEDLALSKYHGYVIVYS